MLYVVFTHLDHPKINKFEKIPFPKAVELTQGIEIEMRENKKEIPGEFHLLQDNSNGDSLYSGTFQFGSYFAPNLFIHIKKNLPSIKADKEKERKRLALMSEMDELIDDNYKKEENLEEDAFRNLDKSKISSLKKGARRTLYGLGLFFALACIVSNTFYLLQISSFNNTYQSVEAETEEQSEVINRYENALLGDRETLIKYLSEKNDLETNEKQIYAKYLAEENNFDKLVELYNDDPKLVATFLTKYTDIEKLKAFHDAYPTNEAKFDIAYAENNYKEVISIENVEMTTERSEKKTHA